MSYTTPDVAQDEFRTATWGDFKKAVEAAGVKDDYCIEWIDTGNYPTAKYLHAHADHELKEFTVSY